MKKKKKEAKKETKTMKMTKFFTKKIGSQLNRIPANYTSK